MGAAQRFLLAAISVSAIRFVDLTRGTTMNPLPPGMTLWLTSMVAAIFGPPLFFAWRRRDFRYSLRAVLVLFSAVAVLSIWLKRDISMFHEILSLPNAATKILWIEFAVLASWIASLLADGMPVLIRRQRGQR